MLQLFSFCAASNVESQRALLMGADVSVEDDPVDMKDVAAAPVVKKPKRAKAKAETATADVEEEPIRARDEKGKFLPDDPTTADVNEAWVGEEREN